MALLKPDWQEFVDNKNGTVVGLTLVTPLSITGDTVEVPQLAQVDADSVSSAVLRRVGQTSSPTITDSATTSDNTLTLASTIVGEQVLIVTVHASAMLNFGDEVTDD